ncbi:MAG: SH3 domain-containing protein [Bacteroidota bacterium]
METKFGFQLMDINEFGSWLANQQVSRVISLIQNHHTFLPDYTHFTGNNHFARLKSMKEYHMVKNHWSNIAQTFTTFPDGKIAVCRSLNDIPVGIKEHNSKGICIEHFGNFDRDKDQMTPEHRDAILKMNAMLCKKFNLPADTDHIVYHHWYDLKSGQRLNGKGVTKSCPGTAFFGGNKVEDAKAGFIPLIEQEIGKIAGIFPIPKPLPASGNRGIAPEAGIVSVASLNVRKGPGTDFPVVSVLSAGAMVSIYEGTDGWARIGTDDEWIAQKFLIKVSKGQVKASSLTIRSGPGTQFSSLGTLPKGSEVLVYETKIGWSRIDINEKWVSSQYLI